MIFNNTGAVHRAARRRRTGCAVSDLAGDDMGAGRLVKVMPTFPPVRLPLTIVYASRRNLPLRVRAVLNFLVYAPDEDLLMDTAETAA